MDTTPQIIAALLALGIALAFIVADRQAPTSRALSIFLASIGISIALYSQVELRFLRGNDYPAWGGIFALPEVLAFYFAYEWVLRIRRTIPARNSCRAFWRRKWRNWCANRDWRAPHAEVLVDERTVELVGFVRSDAELVCSAPRKLKGFAQPVRSYLLAQT
jgi:hypothetical protein